MFPPVRHPRVAQPNPAAALEAPHQAQVQLLHADD